MGNLAQQFYEEKNRAKAARNARKSAGDFVINTMRTQAHLNLAEKLLVPACLLPGPN
jgi:hypothetical protein